MTTPDARLSGFFKRHEGQRFTGYCDSRYRDWVIVNGENRIKCRKCEYWLPASARRLGKHPVTK
jgi:hypothetical protein